MPFEYHVTCKDSDSKKKVSTESKAEVIAAIQQRFDVQHDIVVQQPFEDDWLDVDDWNELSDGGKLRFLRKPSSVIPTTPSHTEVLAVEPSSSASVPPASTPQGFARYALPNLPNDIMQLLNAQNPDVATCRRERARITQILYDDLRSRVGLYPSNHEVKNVCHTLVMTYPCLEDKIKIGQNNTKFYTWVESLRQKFKDSRRSLTSDVQVLQMKEKYGKHAGTRRKGDPMELMESPKSKTPRLGLLPVGDDGEDERSVENHIAVIQQQWGKANCDIGMINDRMVRTYTARRDLIKSGAKLVDILYKYPPLKDQTQLEMEFVRMTRVNFVDCLKAFWTRQRIEVAVKMLRKDKTVQDIVACVEGTNVTDDKLNILMRVLPRLFGERLLCWTQSAKDDPEEIAGRLTVYPTVVVGNEEVSVYFERSIITRCSDILQATATVVMIYYVFDVQYPAELANTCNFLDCSIGRLDQKMKIRPAVQRKLNLLLAA